MNLQNRTLVVAIALPLALAACNNEAPEPVDDMETSDAGSDITEEEIEEAVPGIEDADPEGDTPNTADLRDSENLDTTEPDEADEYLDQDR